tara:strand:- start:750 stop:2171 length:1422 start_codon:yes stop_codon:yes gene_type:complete
MLKKLRNFSKGKLAAVLVAIIIIPFVFWGMGSVFSGGNTNSIAKINNQNVSTKDFMNFLNKSKIQPELIKENIDNNLIEQLMTQLISIKLIDIEVENLKVKISDNDLAFKIKNQETFQDENKKFSRVKYEKFLLENNLTVTDFEKSIKDNELKKKLFSYIGGGIKTPYFLTNKNYKNETKKINVLYFDLKNIYKKEQEFTENEILSYINNNKDKFKNELITLSYLKITPDIITDQKEFNESFFAIIDEIENLILNGKKLEEIAKMYSLTTKNVERYDNSGSENFLKEIYNKKNEEKIQLIDKNDYFLLYEIKEIIKVLPDTKDENFIKKVKKDIYENNKYELHKKLLTKIQTNKFTDQDFKEITDGYDSSKKTVNGINDFSKFNSESVNLLYSLPKNSFLLLVDNSNNIYLSKINEIYEKNLDKFDKNLSNYLKKSKDKVKNNLFSSYDFLLNEKYKIKINQKTLERIKNYFR